MTVLGKLERMPQVKSSSLPSMQARVSQPLQYTASCVSKLVISLQVVAVILLPVPVTVYHTPGDVVEVEASQEFAN